MKIGLSVIGYSRPQYLDQCLASLDKYSWGGATYKQVVLDYRDEKTRLENIAVAAKYGVSNIVYFTENKGVAKTKNEALKRMLNEDCDHLFLMEDDILMTAANVCHEYINTANTYGVQHLNFAHHGPANKGHKRVLEWNDKLVLVHPHCVGAFSYYSKECLEKVGLIDEKFHNAWEHVEHTKRIIDAGMHPPFWHFADCPLSPYLLQEIPGSIDESSIRPRSDWRSNIEAGKEYWIKKHNQWLPPFAVDFWNR